MRKIVIPADWKAGVAAARAGIAQAAPGERLALEVQGSELYRLAMIQTVLPYKQTAVDGTGCVWTNDVPTVCVTIRDYRPVTDVLIFVTSCCRPDMLDSAVASVAKTGQDVLVVDGLKEQVLWEQYPWFEKAGVIRCPFNWTFTQAMNVGFQVAAKHKKRWFIYIHADMESQDQEIVFKLVNHAITHESKHVGIWFTNYDLVACYDMRAVAEVGFVDETFWNYYQDCDYHRRLRLAGWGTENSPYAGPFIHQGSYAVREFGPKKTLWNEPAGQQWHSEHYLHKWGGQPNGEVNTTPYRL